MCKALFKTPEMPDPVMPPQYAAMKQPNAQNASQAGQVVKAKAKSGNQTLLAGAAASYKPADTTGRKVLLGQ